MPNRSVLTSQHEIVIRPGTVPFAFFSLAFAVLLFYVLWVAQGVLVPLVTALFLSFLVTSVKRIIDRVPVIGRRLPSWLGFLLSFLLIATTIFLLALIVKQNIGAVLAKAPEYQARFAQLAEDLLVWAENTPILPAEVVNGLAGIVEGIGSGFSDTGGSELSGPPDAEAATAAEAARETLKQQAFAFMRDLVGGFTSAAGGLLGAIVTTILYTAFILVERGRIVGKILKIAGGEGNDTYVDKVLSDIATLVRSYISIKTVISLFVALVSFGIMTALGTDFAGFWALLIFAFGFIPIIGAVIAVTLPTLLTLVQPDGGFTKALLTLVLLTGAEQSVSSVIEPKLMGDSLNLSPLVILLSLATWGTLWGFPGMILCIPMTVALMIILSQFRVTRPIAILLSATGEIAPLRK